ncbi:MAG: ATP-binding protein [Pseudomonadota bacterium]
MLRLIASDADLVDCLREIAVRLKTITGGADAIVVALRPESGEAVGAAATDEAMEEGLKALTTLPSSRHSLIVDDLIANQGRSVGLRHDVMNRAGQELGVMIVLGERSKIPAAPGIRALNDLSFLTAYAIEAAGRTRALVAANERFAALAKNIPGVVYQRVVRPNGDIRYTYISDSAKDLFGVSPEEILSDPQALFDCHGPDYYSTFRERLLAASRSLQLWDVEATIIARDGTRKFTHAIARPHREADGTVVWNGVILNQTRIKEAELEAAAASRRTRDAIIESIPQAFALFDPNDCLVTWNSRFLELYPELNDVIVAGTSYETLLQAELNASIDPIPEGVSLQEHLERRLEQHRQAGHVVERRLPNGRWILINEHHTTDGGVVVLHTDITELKAREAALARSNHELEAFASIASHDLQEPLRKIDAFGDRLKRKYSTELGEDGNMYIDRMRSSVSRMRALINDLLDYSRVTTKAKPFTRVDLTDVVSDVVSDLEVRIEEVEGSVVFDHLPTLDADRTQMRQLFQNLIANAMKFHRENEAPRVEIRAEIAERSKNVNPHRCRIDVIDNGIGFDMKYADRVFGIFQRLHTRAEYEGTGVGLATCRKIAERHQGEISVHSRTGEGTTFSIDIPLRQPMAGGEGARP